MRDGEEMNHYSFSYSPYSAWDAPPFDDETREALTQFLGLRLLQAAEKTWNN